MQQCPVPERRAVIIVHRSGKPLSYLPWFVVPLSSRKKKYNVVRAVITFNDRTSILDARQLRYFTAIVEHNAFSRAAMHLGIAQPALSQHVRNMEQALGTKLLQRNARGVVPTEAGEILLRHAAVILDQFQKAEEEIRGRAAEPAGEVRVGLPGTISEILSVPLISAARRRYPGIKLRIAEAMSGFVLDWMRRGQIDLAVIYREVERGSLATTPILEEELVFFGKADVDFVSSGSEGRIDFANLATVPLILPGPSHGLRQLIDKEAHFAGISLSISTEVDTYLNIKQLVERGFGSAVLPLNAIKREISDGTLRYWRIESPTILRTVYLVNTRDRPMRNATAVIRKLIHEVVGELVAAGEWAGVHVSGTIVPKV